MTDREWYFIQQKREKHEQKQGVKKPDVFPYDDRFTLPDGVPIVPVNDEEDDFDEEKK